MAINFIITVSSFLKMMWYDMPCSVISSIYQNIFMSVCLNRLHQSQKLCLQSATLDVQYQLSVSYLLLPLWLSWGISMWQYCKYFACAYTYTKLLAFITITFKCLIYMMWTSYICRKHVFNHVQHFIHLNLSAALLFGLVTFVSGIETASEYKVSIYQ